MVLFIRMVSMVTQEFEKHDPINYLILYRIISGSLDVNFGITDAIMHVFPEFQTWSIIDNTFEYYVIK